MTTADQDLLDALAAWEPESERVVLLDVRDWWQAGLRGDASGQGASVYAMLAWHGGVVVAVVLSAVYYALRWMRGLAPGPANKTLEALRILFLYAAFEGAVGLLLPRLLP